MRSHIQSPSHNSFLIFFQYKVYTVLSSSLHSTQRITWILAEADLLLNKPMKYGILFFIPQSNARKIAFILGDEAEMHITFGYSNSHVSYFSICVM